VIAGHEFGLEEMLRLILERERNTIGYAYRMGFDVDTGRRIAVEFEMPSYKAMENSALHPCIAHVSQPMAVHEIFDSEYHRFNSAKMIPDYHPCFVAYVKRIKPDIDAGCDGFTEYGCSGYWHSRENEIDWLDYQNTREFKLDFIKFIKLNQNLTTEEYQIGELGGKDKYKSTRLNWSRDSDMASTLRASERRRSEKNNFRTKIFHTNFLFKDECKVCEHPSKCSDDCPVYRRIENPC
jgi:hypothetical protein